MPLLQNKINDWPARILGWHFPHKWGPEGPGLDPFTAIRAGSWKLIYFYKDRRFELYDLSKDLGETTDLGWKQPGKREEMEVSMRRWMSEMNAQPPESRATGEPLPVHGFR